MRCLIATETAYTRKTSVLFDQMGLPHMREDLILESRQRIFSVNWVLCQAIDGYEIGAAISYGIFRTIMWKSLVDKKSDLQRRNGMKITAYEVGADETCHQIYVSTV